MELNTHQKHRFLMCVVTMCIKNGGFLCMSGASCFQVELDRVSQTLTRRIRELAERYATPLPALADQVKALSAKVGEHLERMGVVWK